LPGYDAWVPAAVQWLWGDAPVPVQVHAGDTFGEINPPNDGTELVGAIARLASLDTELDELSRMLAAPPTPEMAESVRLLIKLSEQRLPRVKREIEQAKAALWGTPAEDASDG
jgi:hypothetical protein